MNLGKFLGCIYGVTIGDRLGAPFEGMNSCDIRARFGEIRDLRSTNVPTDDTQLTLATMDAFIESGGIFSMPIIAEKHKQAYRNEWHGWGRSTRRSCKRLCDKSGGWDWTNSGEPDGAGNGVIMKIAPLGLWGSVTKEDVSEFTKMCIEYARMTHLATPAIVAGVVHATAIATLAAKYDSRIHVYTFLSFLKDLAEILESNLPPWNDKISSQIENIMNYVYYGSSGKLGEQTPEKIALLFGGGTSYAYNSFGLSYAIFARSALNPDNPEPFNAVFDAVNAGGDTDTNASIVGSLVGAFHGMKAIPEKLVSELEDKNEIRQRTEEFYKACIARA
jgi:poly(ADP-ribose) glycohydrolase ARH3